MPKHVTGMISWYSYVFINKFCDLETYSTVTLGSVKSSCRL